MQGHLHTLRTQGLVDCDHVPEPLPRRKGTVQSEARQEASFMQYDVLIDADTRDPQAASVLSAARRLAASEFEQDLIRNVSRSSTQRLALVTARGTTQPELIGYLVYNGEKDYTEILQIAVSAMHRRKGVGRRLVEMLVAHVRTNFGMKVVLARVQPANISFFLQIGFVSSVGADENIVIMTTDARLKSPAVPSGAQVQHPDVTDERQRVIQLVFEAYDRDGDGYLLSDEMRIFATNTGFQGDSETWDREYAKLCSEDNIAAHLSKGIDLAQFYNLVNDPSASGCFCTDQELWELISRPARNDSAKPEAERSKLARCVFDTFDRNGDGFLCEREFKTFAVYTGFEGDDERWSTEYRGICDEADMDPVVGVGFTSFLRFVDDKTDRGCYCDDAELRRIADQYTWLARRRVTPDATDVTVKTDIHDHLPQVPRLSMCKVEPSTIGMDILRRRTDQQTPRPFTASGEDDISGDRKELIRQFFQVCDVDCDGLLNKWELERVASLLGTLPAGSDWEEWYANWCKHHGLDLHRGAEIDKIMPLFSKRSDEKARPGGKVDFFACRYCSDVELRRFVEHRRAYEAVNRAHQVKVSTFARTPKLSGQAGEKPGGFQDEHARKSLISAIFQLSDSNDDCLLSAEEMLPFAEMTGFTGGKYEWVKEHKLLCQEKASVGVDEALFTSLVDDDSSNGCYCTDDDLRIILVGLSQKFAALSPRRGGISPNATENSSASSTCEAQTCAKSKSRFELLNLIFDLCDEDRDGKLNSQELLTFAGKTGFEGTMEEWEIEYQILCKTVGADPPVGLGLSAFDESVTNSEVGGSYCTDEELVTVHKVLAKDAQNHAKTGLPEGIFESAFDQPASPENSARPMLIRRVFALLDVDADGRLKEADMLKFALLTGFNGTSEDWKEEYDLLSKIHLFDGNNGVDVRTYETILNDRSAGGSFCTDDELRMLIDGLASRPQDLIEEEKLAHNQTVPGVTNWIGTGDRSVRRAMIRLVFAACDLDSDGRLNELELLRFGVQTGFDGSVDDWSQEYQALCEENKVNAITGFDIEHFERFVNDDGDCGCLCTEKELHRVLYALQAADVLPVSSPLGAAGATADSVFDDGDCPRQFISTDTFEDVSRSEDDELMFAAEHPNSDLHHRARPVSRQSLIREIFTVCDRDQDGLLNRIEMGRFAKQVGFDGVPSEWALEYESLCRDNKADASDGVDLDLFIRILNDKSDIGLYCQDDELLIVLQQISHRPSR